MSEIINNSINNINSNDIKLNNIFPIISHKINILIESFNSHDTTHPVLSKLWTNTLETYKNKLYMIEKIIEQGESLIEKLPDKVSDPNINTILLISAILSNTTDLDVDTNTNLDIAINIDTNTNTNTNTN